MRKQYTDFSTSERYHKNIKTMQVIAVDDGGAVTLLHRYPNGEAETTKIMCSFGTELTPVKDYLDVEMYLTGNNQSYRILGVTPPEYQPKN